MLESANGTSLYNKVICEVAYDIYNTSKNNNTNMACCAISIARKGRERVTG